MPLPYKNILVYRHREVVKDNDKQQPVCFYMVNEFLISFYKKYPIAVTEKWDWWHTDEHRKELWAKLDEMRKQGKTSYTDNGTYSHYAEDGSPTKYFRDMEAAEEYMNWLDKWKPVSLTVKNMAS